MNKLVLFVLVTLFALSTNASAMTFSQPVKTGAFFSTPRGGFVFEKVSTNSGKSVSYFDKNRKLYDKGIAVFGTNEDALYLYYDDNKKTNVTFGIQDGKNVFALDYHMFELGCDIRQIKTDKKFVFYAVTIFNGNWGSSNWIILGKSSDGALVKYFETNDIRKKYFDNPRYVDFNEIRTKGNSIIISYKYFYPQKEHKGEFRFKWDDAVQWFGVEQVVY